MGTIHEDNLVKHPIFWFDDGSIVLRVQNHLFKVHRSLLSRHSRLFAPGSHILSTSSLSTVSDHDLITIDPSRRVMAGDVEVLFEHLYHDVPIFSEMRFPRIASILRVSSPLQLDFPSIYSLAKERLYFIFPPDATPPSCIDNLEESPALLERYQLVSMRKFRYYDLVTSADSNLESETDSSHTHFAPTVTSTSTISSKPEAEPSDGPTPTEVPSNAHYYTLSKTDEKLCKQLMTHLIDHFTPTLFTPPATPHIPCTDVFADTWMTLVIQFAITNDGVYKPLETLERIKDIDWAKEGLCKSCVKEKRGEWTEEQKNIWKAMDEWLGPPTDSSDIPI